MKRRTVRQALQSTGYSDHPLQGAISQSSSQHITLIDLPAACLHLICQHLGDSDSKLAAFRSCKLLQSAVLEACMLLLKLQFPRQPMGPASIEQQAKLLQQAKEVGLEFHFQDEYLGNEPRAVGGMRAWLAELKDQCNGPATSVSRLVFTGLPKGVLRTLPDWVPTYCPNLVHLAVRGQVHFDPLKCDIKTLISCVYSKLKSVHLKETYVVINEGVVPHVSALLDAPHVTHMTLSLGTNLKQSFAHRACHLGALHMVDAVTAVTLTQLPYKGVEHLVIGNEKRMGYFDLALGKLGLEQPGQIIRDVCAHLNMFSSVTLSTDAGIQLGCRDLTAAEVMTAMSLLKYAKPYMLPPDRAVGALRIFGLTMVTQGYVKVICSELPLTITKLSFRGDTFWQGAALETLSLLPPHITGFTILTYDHHVVWRFVKQAFNHAVRPMTLFVPTYRPNTTSGHRWTMEDANNDVSRNWPAIVRSMQAHGHQHVSVQVVDYDCC